MEAKGARALRHFESRSLVWARQPKFWPWWPAEWKGWSDEKRAYQVVYFGKERLYDCVRPEDVVLFSNGDQLLKELYPENSRVKKLRDEGLDPRVLQDSGLKLAIEQTVKTSKQHDYGDAANMRSLKYLRLFAGDYIRISKGLLACWHETRILEIHDEATVYSTGIVLKTEDGMPLSWASCILDHGISRPLWTCTLYTGKVLPESGIVTTQEMKQHAAHQPSQTQSQQQQQQQHAVELKATDPVSLDIEYNEASLALETALKEFKTKSANRTIHLQQRLQHLQQQHHESVQDAEARKQSEFQLQQRLNNTISQADGDRKRLEETVADERRRTEQLSAQVEQLLQQNATLERQLAHCRGLRLNDVKDCDLESLGSQLNSAARLILKEQTRREIEKEQDCSICTEHKPLAVFNCGHAKCCVDCAPKVAVCPFCNVKISLVTRLHM